MPVPVSQHDRGYVLIKDDPPKGRMIVIADRIDSDGVPAMPFAMYGHCESLDIGDDIVLVSRGAEQVSTEMLDVEWRIDVQTLRLRRLSQTFARDVLAKD